MKFRLLLFLALGLAGVQAQDDAPAASEEVAAEAISEATGEQLAEPAGAIAAEEGLLDSGAPDGGTAAPEDAAVVEEDAAAMADELPAAPSDAEPIVAEDIIPLAPMPDLSLPDEEMVGTESLFIDAPPEPPPAAVTIESVAQRQRDELILYREVRLKADQDPQVMAMRERADNAKTFEDQRAALREYYRLLFARVAKIDKSLEGKAKIMEEAYIRRLAQMRLEPTIPLNPPPTPEPLP